MRHRGVLDHPNERSLHAVAKPRGGGLALSGSVLLVWTALAMDGRAAPAVIGIVSGALLLGIVSWIDDLRGLSAVPRLLAQAAAVVAGLFTLPQTGNPLMVLLGPPLYLALCSLLWVWWINLFNFMDGIDGLAGGEAAAIGLGLVLFAGIGVGFDPPQALLAAAILGAAMGFLVWNWAPARIFLGDVGSTTLGYLTGFLLLGAAGRGHWRIALILPLYFLSDATLTLARRLLRRERFWQAHREHCYQLAVGRGLGHAAVVRRVIAADLWLIACGWTAENGGGALSLAMAAAGVGILLAALVAGR